MFYAVYRNDEELLAVGSAKEVAKQLKINVSTVYSMACPSWRKQSSVTAYKFEDDEEY